jgi:hypothetical protein
MGADSKLFADVVDKGFLPKDRAERCEREYQDFAFAFKMLVEPHIDPELAKAAHKAWSQGAAGRRARFAR